jgi:hypothetical protein
MTATTRQMPAWEVEHNRRLVETLRSASITEEETADHETIIRLGHLSGRVGFADGVMYWSVSGHADIGGEQAIDQSDINRSAAALRNYGRKAVRDNLTRLADRIIRSFATA